MVKNETLNDLRRNLIYWQAQINLLDDKRIHQLSPRYMSFLWAVDLGIRSRQTRVDAAELTLLAFPWIERERHEQDWLPIMQRFLQSAEIRQLPTLHTQMLKCYGILLRLNTQLNEAVAIHQQALNTIQPGKDLLITIELHFNLSENYRCRHQISEAMHHAKQAQHLLIRHPDDALQAKILNTLGLLLLDVGELEQAANSFQQALVIERQIGHPTRLARVLNNLALSAKRQRQFELALSYYTQSLNTLEETSNVIDRITTYINQGSLHFKMEHWGLAETAFHFAQSLLHHNHGLYFFEAMVNMNLGKVAQVQHKYTDAMILFKSSEALWQQLEDNIYLGNVRGAIAEVYVTQGDLNSARHYYWLAIKHLTPYVDHAWAKSLLREFSLALQMLEDMEN